MKKVHKINKIILTSISFSRHIESSFDKPDGIISLKVQKFSPQSPKTLKIFRTVFSRIPFCHKSVSLDTQNAVLTKLPKKIHRRIRKKVGNKKTV